MVPMENMKPRKTRKEEVLDRQIANLDARTRKANAKLKEKIRERNKIQRKQRTHRLIQLGAVIESVLGRPVTDADVIRLFDLLRFLEDEDDHYFSDAMNGAFDYRHTK